MIEIRAEHKGDQRGIRRVNELPFAPRLNEADVVDVLRDGQEFVNDIAQH